MKIYIDADKIVVGRLGTYVAKEALKGNEVVVINSEKAIISGNRDSVIEKISTLRKKGGYSQKGPQIPKVSDRLLKRMFRGMLPWDRPRGKEAYKRIRCYIGNKLTEEENKKLKKLKIGLPIKYVEMGKIVKLI